MNCTVILANGAKPTSVRAQALISVCNHLVCCDGALKKARELGREPDLVVGDCDSLTPAEAKSLGDRLVKIAEQETNDLDKAFRTAVSRYGTEGIIILGASGLREDHLLGNVFHLIDFAAVAPSVQMFTDEGAFSVVNGREDLISDPGDAVSIFAPYPSTRVKSTGLKWPLDNVSLDSLWKGTLNRATGEFFTIECDHPVIVYKTLSF